MATLQVLETTLPVVESARHVRVDRQCLTALCRQWVGRPLEVPSWDEEIHWSDGGPATLNYILLLDALNFCFWCPGGSCDERWAVQVGPRTYNGYKALAAALKRAVMEGVPLTSADYLAQMSGPQLAEILRGNVTIPNFEQRLANAREVGQVLVHHFEGQFARAVERARGSAVALVELLVEHFSSFRDEATYRGARVRILKRAQIAVVDVFGTFQGHTWGQFHDIAELTAFADYKIPQVLRAQGVLVYSEDLAARVDAKVELPAGSEEEIEIRAAMIWAVEWIRQELELLGRTLAPYQLDWLLWNIGQETVPNERPYHRTRTFFY